MKPKSLLPLFVAIAVAIGGLLVSSPAHAQPTSAQQAQKPVTVRVDGIELVLDVPPVIQDSRTLVPFRAIGEALGKEVSWDAAAQMVTARDSSTVLQLFIGKNTAYANGISLKLDVPPAIVEGRTLVPLRFISEAFGCEVFWSPQSRAASVTSPVRSMQIAGFYALGSSETSSWRDLFGAAYPAVGQERTHLVSEVAMGWFSLGADGQLLTTSQSGWRRPDGWEMVLAACELRQLHADMTVHLTDSSGTLSGILASTEASGRAAEAIAKEAQNYAGVNLDFEGLGWKQEGDALTKTQAQFTQFVSQLSGRLKASRRQLTVTLHPPNSVYKGYDYKALGQVADRIIIMAYDYGSEPEPNSLVIEAARLAVELVPADKLLLGISAVSETPESIIAKVGIAKRYGLKGIALWRLGLMSAEQWAALETTARPNRDR